MYDRVRNNHSVCGDKTSASVEQLRHRSEENVPCCLEISLKSAHQLKVEFYIPCLALKELKHLQKKLRQIEELEKKLNRDMVNVIRL